MALKTTCNTRSGLRPFAIGGLAALTLGGTLAGAQEHAVTVRPQLVLELGRDLEEEEDYTLIRVRDVIAGRDGRLYVLDVGEPDVKVFSQSGRFLRSIGRAGAGPGEFTHPSHLQLGNNAIKITDFMQRRTSTFTFEGKHIETRRYESPAKDGFPAVVRPGRGGSALLLTYPSGSNSRRQVTSDPYARVVFSSSDGASLDTLLAIRGDVALWRIKGSWIANFLNAGVGDGGAWALSGDSLLATADGYSGEVRWYKLDARSATVVRRASLLGQSRPVSSSDIARAEARLKRESRMARGAAIEISEFPARWSVATHAVFADDGSLWIAPPPADEPFVIWTIFPPGDRPPYAARLPRTFTLSSVRQDLLYGHSISEDETPVVQVYRMPSG
jgi:hypothetical protein